MNDEEQKSVEQPQPEGQKPVEQKLEEQPVEPAEDFDDVPAEEPFTVETGKQRAVEAVGRVKKAGSDFSKEITTRPLLDAVGSYFTRGIDALISLAEGLEGKSKKKGRK